MAEVKIELPEGVNAKVENEILIVSGPKGEVRKSIKQPLLNFEIKDGSIVIITNTSRKNEIKMANTYRAHVNNMVKGASEGHNYQLKVCASHFPMNVSVNKNQLIIKNFIGEKNPRSLDIKEGVTVKVENDIINVDSNYIELAGNFASDAEKLTRRAGFDKRIFQDGIYIISKNGKKIK